MTVRNENLFGFLVSALLAIIWHLSVCPTLAEERNSTMNTTTFPNYSTESIPDNATKPYPQKLVKPYPILVAPKPFPTAKRRKSTKSSHRLNSKVNKKKHAFYQRTMKGKMSRKDNRGRHDKTLSKRKHYEKVSKQHHRPTKKKRTKTIRTKATAAAGEYYYEEYYVDVTSTPSNTQLASHQDGYTATVGTRRTKENYTVVTKFGISNGPTGVSTSEEPVPRLIEYESFGRLASGVTAIAMPPLHQNLMLKRCLGRTLNVGCAISIIALSSSVKFIRIIS